MVLDLLCPEWDILIEIQEALDLLPRLLLKFIKGHQDNTTPYGQLPLLARLNVDADAQAGQFQDLHGKDRPVVLITPLTRALSHLIEGTVTSSCAATIRHAYCGPPLLEYIRIKNKYIRIKNKWLLASINWTAHGSALRKQIPRRRHYVKLVHDVLPTHSQQNRLDKGKRTCPSCTSTNEDRDHIMRCPSSDRNKWHHKLLTALSNACTTHHTYEPLKQLLLDSVRLWLYSGPEQNRVPTCDQYAVELYSLITSQTYIGWRQLLNGRFSSEWGEGQNKHLYNIRQHLPTKNNSGQKW